MTVIPNLSQPVLRTVFCSSVLPVIKLTDRVWKLTLKYFGLIQAVGVLGFGAQEFGLSFLPTAIRWKNEPDERIQDLAAVRKIMAIQAEQSGVHGLLYVGSGVLCTAGELEASNLAALGGMGQALLKSGWTLFLFANLFSLEQNIKLYHAAMKVEGTLGHRLKVTAILGMINNLGYVLGTIYSFFPAMNAISITLAIFAIMAGTIKFIYDFFLISLPNE